MQMFSISKHIAALSTVRGGVLIDDYLFCAIHYPGGIDAGDRTTCQQCQPVRRSLRRSF
jgi:hypothetical protein